MNDAAAARFAVTEWQKNDWLFVAVRHHHREHDRGPIVDCRESECVAVVVKAADELEHPRRP